MTRTRFALMSSATFALGSILTTLAAAQTTTPSAADLAKARTFITTKMTPEAQKELSELAKKEGKTPEQLLLRLIDPKTLGVPTGGNDESGVGSNNSGDKSKGFTDGTVTVVANQRT